MKYRLHVIMFGEEPLILELAADLHEVAEVIGTWILAEPDQLKLYYGSALMLKWNK